VRQLFIEGLTCAFAGGLLGTGAAYASVLVLKTQLPDLPRISELSIDARTVAMIVGISLFTAVFFSLAPVVQTFRRDTASTLIRSGRGVIGGRQRLPRILVTAQLALATALLIGAGLFLQSMVHLQEVNLGFRTSGILLLRVGASFNEAPAAAIQRHKRTMDAIAAVPGVVSVAMSSGIPGANRTWPREFEIAGEPAADGTLHFATWRIVTSGYFQTLGIPLLSGNTCRMNLDPAMPFEAIINRSFADRYFAGRDPIGHRLTGGPGIEGDFRIIGVAADSREDGHSFDPQPLIYSCGYLKYWPDSNYLIHTRSSPSVMANAVSQAVRSLEPSRAIYSVRPMEDALSGALAQSRFRTLLVTLFSAMALTLAAIGLYGVMAYMIAQRTREIGIRVALGARPYQIIGEILSAGGLLTATGSVAGALLAAIASGLIAALLYGVRPFDVATYAGAIGVLFLVSLIACLIPSRRATSIDPTEALR
jgi:predicted permease